MNAPIDAQSQMKITVYFWKKGPGVGHIACLAEEIGGSERKMYISPGYIGQYSKDVTMAVQQNIEKSSTVMNSFLETEMASWHENPIKINLPNSVMSYDDFLRNFSIAIISDIKKGYSLFLRNCAHHTNKALMVAYPGYRQPSVRFGLLPGAVANSACKLLGGESKKRLKFVKDSIDIDLFEEDPISYISRFKFARSVMFRTLLEIRRILFSGIYVNDDAFLENFDEILREFITLVNATSSLNDCKITENFKNLKNCIILTEKKLITENIDGFERSNRCLVTSGCILADDPLSQLKKFKQELLSYYEKCLEKKFYQREDMIEFI